jgi:hypothetical protein
MGVWTWSAGEHACGVTDSPWAARKHVHKLLGVGEHGVVQKVEVQSGFRTMSSYYFPTGIGWSVTRSARGIEWAQLHTGTSEDIEVDEIDDP